MSKLTSMGHALYTGQLSINFVGRRRLWYAISGLIVIIAALGMFFKGFDYGIEFVGGTQFKVSVPSSQVNNTNVDKIQTAVAGTGIPAAAQPIVQTSGSSNILVQTKPLNNHQTNEIAQSIEHTVPGVTSQDISTDSIGATWGAQIANRAIVGLIVFLCLVMVFIWAYFREWKMSVAAIVALFHDLIITVGVYALSGFQVSPATVTGVLTILGFSLYDTVVVFDKVRENTKNLARTRQTYAEAANLAVNQTLVRSINTSLVALLPVGAMLYVGAVTLGSGDLKDLALALFVGMAAGAYSSIFIATPLAVQLKEMEPGVKAGDARVRRKRVKETADRFAHVPAAMDDGPVPDRPLPLRTEPESEDRVDEDAEAVAARRSAPRAPRPTAGERPANKPVSQSRSAKRAQPSRRSRSQRGKK